MDPLLPKQAGKCDQCGKNLIIREDDTAPTIKACMAEYNAKTKPLLEVFEKMGKLLNIEAKKGVKDYPQIKKLVEGHLAKK